MTNIVAGFARLVVKWTCLSTMNCLNKTPTEYKMKTVLKRAPFAGYTENCDGECVSSCKPYWVEIESHCYFWSKIQLNWVEAEATCRKQGGHLASITSKAINDRVSNETERSHKDHKSMWIGGTDTEEEAVYRWSDCNPFCNWTNTL